MGPTRPARSLLSRANRLRTEPFPLCRPHQAVHTRSPFTLGGQRRVGRVVRGPGPLTTNRAAPTVPSCSSGPSGKKPGRQRRPTPHRAPQHRATQNRVTSSAAGGWTSGPHGGRAGSSGQLPQLPELHYADYAVADYARCQLRRAYYTVPVARNHHARQTTALTLCKSLCASHSIASHLTAASRCQPIASSQPVSHLSQSVGSSHSGAPRTALLANGPACEQTCLRTTGANGPVRALTCVAHLLFALDTDGSEADGSEAVRTYARPHMRSLAHTFSTRRPHAPWPHRSRPQQV